MPGTPWPIRIDDLLFREVRETDIEALQSFRNEPAVNRFMVHAHVDPADLRRDWLTVAASPTDHACVVEREGDVVAMGFLDVVDGPGQPGHPTGTDGLIGYIVDPRFAGRGIGTATARALLQAAFDGLGLRRVTAAAYVDNLASVRILESAGMRRERVSRRALWHQELGWLGVPGRDPHRPRGPVRRPRRRPQAPLPLREPAHRHGRPRQRLHRRRMRRTASTVPRPPRPDTLVPQRRHQRRGRADCSAHGTTA